MVNLSAAWDSNLYVCTKSYDWCVCVCVCVCVLYIVELPQTVAVDM